MSHFFNHKSAQQALTYTSPIAVLSPSSVQFMPLPFLIILTLCHSQHFTSLSVLKNINEPILWHYKLL